MQTLKLKAFDKTTKRIRGVLSINFFNLYIKCAYCNDEIESITEPYPKVLTRDEYKLLRYTGFRDVNGREIYEDDILYLSTDYFDKDGYVIVHETIGYNCMGKLDKSYHGWMIGNFFALGDVARFARVVGNSNVDESFGYNVDELNEVSIKND